MKTFLMPLCSTRNLNSANSSKRLLTFYWSELTLVWVAMIAIGAIYSNYNKNFYTEILMILKQKIL